MKKTIFLISIVLASFVSRRATAQEAVVDISTFHAALDPYGRWVEDPNYGTVWISNDEGFRPYYTGGHWVYTDEGWTWVSDYDWGWAPFHYGRWAYVDGTGWEWVPGYEWAPAWVSWSGNDDYYGWAPLSPGLSIDIAYTSIPINRWCFVPTRYIYSTSIHDHYMPVNRNEELYHHVNAINNVHVSGNIRFGAGPQREEVEKRTHHTIQPRAFTYNDKPGRTTVGTKGVNIYRPEMRRPGVNPTTPQATTAKPVTAKHNNSVHTIGQHTQAPATVTRPVQTQQADHAVHQQHMRPVQKVPVQQSVQRPASQPVVRPAQQPVVRPHVEPARPVEQQHPSMPVQQHMQPQAVPAQHNMPEGNGGGRSGGGEEHGGGRKR